MRTLNLKHILNPIDSGINLNHYDAPFLKIFEDMGYKVYLDPFTDTAVISPMVLSYGEYRSLFSESPVAGKDDNEELDPFFKEGYWEEYRPGYSEIR